MDEKKPQPIVSNELFDALSNALGLPPYLQRVVIDVEQGKFVKVYVEMAGDERLIQIDWAGHLKNTEVKIVKGSGWKS